jgi:hypothetical protein
MTAIWDTLGNIALELSDPTSWNETKAKKLKQCMTAIYMAIKDRPEYQTLSFDGVVNLLEALEGALKHEPLNAHACFNLESVISALHDFDHLSIPTEFGPTFGHHTEVIITRKRANRQYAKVLKDIHNKEWWTKE